MKMKEFLRQHLTFKDKYVVVVVALNEWAALSRQPEMLMVTLSSPVEPSRIRELVEQYLLSEGYYPQQEWKITETSNHPHSQARWHNGREGLAVVIGLNDPAPRDLIVSTTPIWDFISPIQRMTPV
jgi:hypothetical protein